MKCTYCGEQINQEMLFCPSCGQSVKVTKEPKSRKKLIVWGILSSCIAVALAVTLVILLFKDTGASITSSGKSFSSPEDAAEFLTTSIANNDIDAALSAFATSDSMDHFDFQAYVERLDSFAPSAFYAPDYDPYTTMNKIDALKNNCNTIKGFIYSLVSDYKLNETIRLADNNLTPAEIYAQLDPAKVKGLKLVQIDYFNPEIQDRSQMKKNMAAQEAIFGISDIKEYCALYELEGEYYYGSILFCKYEGKWRIHGLYGLLSGTPRTGALTKTSVNEYEAFIKGEGNNK